VLASVISVLCTHLPLLHSLTLPYLQHSNNSTLIASFCCHRTMVSRTISITDLLHHIAEQDWELFQSIALSKSTTFRAITNAIGNSPEFSGVTLLHAAVRFNPPLDVVKKMIDICPDLIAAKDCLGRTPLHVAAGSSAEPTLIKLLAHAYPASCDATDEDGKTPLHFACDTSCQLFEDEDAIKRVQRGVCHDTVIALLSESLHASTIEDIDEMNALEYAIMSDAKLKTIKLLQHASCKSFRSRSTSNSPSPSPCPAPKKMPRRVSSQTKMDLDHTLKKQETH
jgi:ankyrin repeat protein